jgi:hypothetical protein
MEKKLIYFLHIPKAAGSTFNGFLINKNYSQNERFRIIPTPGEEIRFKNQDNKEDLKIVHGHFLFGLHEAGNIPFTYFTLLRDPVSRIISFYSFIREQKTHALHSKAMEMNLTEFLLSQVTTEVNNGQLRYISGLRGVGFGNCSREQLQIAKDNLDKYFSVVGITEYFDETILLLSHTFNWKHKYYISQNKTKNKIKITDRDIKTIRELNELDFELYEYGKKIFFSTLHNRIPDIDSRIKRYKLINKRYQLANNIYSSIPSVKNLLKKIKSKIFN